MRLADLNEATVSLADVRTVVLTEAERKKYNLVPDDILFIRVNGSRDRVGSCFVVPEMSECCAYCDHLVRGKSVTSILPRYLLAVMSNSIVRTAIDNGIVCAAGQNTISQGVLKPIIIPVPPLAEQRRIVDVLDKHLALVDGIERDRANLDALFAQLKSKVLDLAVRGELVEHDPEDEPAGELLARIREEKLAMVERGELKQKDIKNDTVIFTGSDGLRYEKPADGKGKAKCIEDEIPFEIPEGWSWARLGMISNYGKTSSTPIESIDDKAWILDLEDIEKDTGRVLSKLRKEERSPSSSKRAFKDGQLLYSKLRPYLNKVLIADEDGFCTSEIMPIELYGGIQPRYIRRCLMSPYFLAYANQCAYGCKMPRLGVGDGKKGLVPIPPLDEQRRIDKAIETAFGLTNL